MVERAQHGATQHSGRQPGQGPADRARQHERSRLLRALDDAVRSEQYERAAKLKHQLADLNHSKDVPDDNDGAGESA